MPNHQADNSARIMRLNLSYDNRIANLEREESIELEWLEKKHKRIIGNVQVDLARRGIVNPEGAWRVPLTQAESNRERDIEKYKLRVNNRKQDLMDRRDAAIAELATSTVLPQTSDLTPIRTATLSETDSRIIVNGNIIIPFNRRRTDTESGDTSRFVIMTYLWKSRYESRNGRLRVLDDSDYCYFRNLKKISGCNSDEAIIDHLKKIQTKFKNKHVAITIERLADRARLIVNYG